MNIESRLQRLTNSLKRFVINPRVVEVNVWKDESEAQALERFYLSNQIFPNDEVIFIHVKSNEQIRGERFAKGDT